MTAPIIDNRISTGNILVILGMVASLAVGWGALNSSATNLAMRQTEMTATVSAHESRIRALEMANARVDERMILILDSLRKIEGRLETVP